MRIIHVRPAPVPAGNGTSRSLGDKRHDPVWARIAEAGVPVAFHLGDSGYEASFASAWGSRADFGFGKSDPLGGVLTEGRAIHDAIASLVVHGVFNRHPTLRVASIENGSDWVGLLVKHLRKKANQTPWVFAEDPLDTIRRHVWTTPYLEEDLGALADLIGVERILFGSDWPHGEGVAQPLDFTKELGGFDEADQQRIMHDNVVELLGTSRDRRHREHAELWAEVTAWLEEHWDPDLSVEAWWKAVGAAGWTAPHFTPEQGGRGLSIRSQAVVRRCFAEFGALRPPGGLGLLMAAPTILTQGNADQIDRHVTADPRGPARLGPALQRARRRLRPRRAHHPGGARRRSLGHHRPEGVVVAGPALRLRDAARPHRASTCPSTRASRGSPSSSTSPASPSGRCAR